MIGARRSRAPAAPRVPDRRSAGRVNRPIHPWLALAVAVLSAAATAGEVRDRGSSVSPEQRCGWFENPTPNNAWLIDRDRTWLIASQSAEAPEIEGEWPSGFGKDQWVRSNVGSYGYGCVCMDVVSDPASGWITRIVDSQAQALAVCLEDRSLPLATGMERPKPGSE